MAQKYADEGKTDKLRETATSNLLNIGTADYLVGKIVPDAVKPGELINWALRLDPGELDMSISDLEDLKDKYEDAVDPHPIQNIDEGWDGVGARTFVERWETLQTYVGEKEDDGRRKYLMNQIKVMKDLRDAMADFKSECASNIEGELGSVRDEYVAALCQEADGAAITSALTDAGTGATLGSMVGPEGTAVGAALGAVLGSIQSFNEANETRMEQMLGLEEDSLSFAHGTPDDLKLATDSVTGESLNKKVYKPGDHSSLSDDGWDFDDGWDPK